MKPILISFLLLAIAFGQLIYSNPFVFTEKRTLAQIPASSSQKIKVPVHRNFIINLPAFPKPLLPNAYRWIVKSPNSIPHIDYNGNSPSGSFLFPNFPSFYQGRQIFNFETITKGVGTITFWYLKPSQVTPQKRYYVIVKVT